MNDVCLSSDNKWIISVSNVSYLTLMYMYEMFVFALLYFPKDCDIRLWHVENCDNIKQVIEQNKTLKNAKIVSVSNKKWY